MSIHKKITLIFRYLLNQDYRDYRRIRHFHIFDPDYFMTLVRRTKADLDQELLQTGDDPLWSYFVISRRQLEQEFLANKSWRQLCDPHPLFDTCYYASRNLDLIGKRHPFSHYLFAGWKQGLNPSPFFDIDYYREHCGWDEQLGEPLLHYLQHYLESAVNSSALFDNGYYLDQSPYPEAVSKNAIKHYKLFGAPAGKSPIPLFSPKKYQEQTDENEYAGIDPLSHYAAVGEASGLMPGSAFDPGYYRERYLKEKKVDCVLANYLSHGVKKGHEINNHLADLSSKPVISVIVPVFDPEPRYLNNCIRSVFYQTYPHWELCLVDDCSTNDHIRELIKFWSERDPRIRVFYHQRNQGISAATQTGAEQAAGDYLGFLDNDDELAFSCLAEVTHQINTTGGEVFYTDEDLVGEDGSRLSTFLKPQFNKALLYSHNYITHFVVVSRARFLDTGGFTGTFDGAQDFDLMLRLAGVGADFQHIPQILYHWRAIGTSTSIAHGQKPHAHEAGKKALSEYFRRCQINAEINDGPVNFHYRVHPGLTTKPSITVVVGIGNSGAADQEKIEWLSSTSGYENCTYVLTGDPQSEGCSSAESADSAGDSNVIATAINRIMKEAEDDWIAILGAGAEQISEGWLVELISKCSLSSGIGIVCGRVSYGNGDGPSFTLADVTNGSTSYYRDFLTMASRHANGLHNLQYINACDYQLCLIHRSLIKEIGQLDIDTFPVHLAMLDFSYRAVARGYNILYTPEAILSFADLPMMTKDEDSPVATEKKHFQTRHLAQLRQFDHWYNPGQMVMAGVSKEDFFRWLTGKEN